MSIQSEITRLNGAKEDIADAIVEKGGTLEEGAKLDAMAAGVRSIPTGGSGDFTLGITGASAGDIVSISAVDSSGAPTEYTHSSLPTIPNTGILKGDGFGGIAVAASGTDYGTYSKPSSGIPYTDLADDAKMVILTYGTSTWAEFLAAYNTNRIIYCRIIHIIQSRKSYKCSIRWICITR